MYQIFAEYSIFSLKFLTIVLGILAILIVYAYVKAGDKTGNIVVQNLNDRFNSLTAPIKLAKDGPKKSKNKSKKTLSNNVYVVSFDGDVRASGTENLRKEVTAILQIAGPEDEVVVKLNSSGGMVHRYGFAASQLARIKEKGIPLTVCIDDVAASGGYMMACVANKIVAAPFAVLGSIGVVAQIPNINKWLKQHNIDVDVFTAGKYKRTVTVMGENTEEGKQKFKAELQITHDLFKKFVKENRPSVDIESLATGETWYGRQAIENNLVDLLQTSDDYLLRKATAAKIYHIKYVPHKQYFGQSAETFARNIIDHIMSRLNLYGNFNV